MLKIKLIGSLGRLLELWKPLFCLLYLFLQLHEPRTTWNHSMDASNYYITSHTNILEDSLELICGFYYLSQLSCQTSSRISGTSNKCENIMPVYALFAHAIIPNTWNPSRISLFPHHLRLQALSLKALPIPLFRKQMTPTMTTLSINGFLN